MRKDQLYIGCLFGLALILGMTLGFRDAIQTNTLILTIFLYWLFSTLYYNLRYVFRIKKDVSLDYGISYSLSIAVFIGPLGLLIYEALYRTSVYITRKVTNTADPEEGLHTFYNIGSFTLSSTAAYFFYWALESLFSNIPFGFWLLILLSMFVVVMLSDIFLSTILFIWNEIDSRQSLIQFIKDRSFNDTLKSALTNGFLLFLLFERHYELIFIFFLINYTINRSIVFKAKATQDRLERDQFEAMAYTDFLTEAYNRAYMNKRMEELANTEKTMAVVLADLDRFKQLNDQYNHHVGDQAIQHFIKIVNKHIRHHGEVFRSGGEEFTIFLYDLTYKESCQLIDELRIDISKTPVTVEYEGQNIEISYTSSFGLYYFQVKGEKSIEKAHIQADKLLYESKDYGRNHLTSIDATNEHS